VLPSLFMSFFLSLGEQHLLLSICVGILLCLCMCVTFSIGHFGHWLETLILTLQ
jgi:hypothetical protein